ncbi:hypothetical protein, partial [Achromobacter xylosoxidans]
MIDDQPGRLGARQADVVAGTFKRHVGIGGVEPETVAVGRGGRGSRHGRHYLSKASVQSIDPKRRSKAAAGANGRRASRPSGRVIAWDGGASIRGGPFGRQGLLQPVAAQGLGAIQRQVRTRQRIGQ